MEVGMKKKHLNVGFNYRRYLSAFGKQETEGQGSKKAVKLEAGNLKLAFSIGCPIDLAIVNRKLVSCSTVFRKSTVS